jgi:hypothetical protein
MHRFVAVTLACVAAASLQAAQDTGADALVAPMRPLAFLLGDWLAAPGSSGETGGFSFKPAVQGRLLVRTNYASYPATADKPALRHDDLMVIAADGDVVRADYFDSEGHIIRYLAQSIQAGQVVLVSEIKPNEPRYRLRYTANADGTLAGQFDVAPPGKPEAFAPYLAWSARRSR